MSATEAVRYSPSKAEDDHAGSDEDDEIDAVVVQAQRQEEGANLREMLAKANSQKQLPGQQTAAAKKRLSVARWKVATTAVKKEARLTTLIKNMFTSVTFGSRKQLSPREPKPQQAQDKKHGGWGLVRGLRSIFRFGTIAKEIAPITRSTEVAPEAKASATYHLTQEEALAQNKAFKKTMKKQGIKTTVSEENAANVPLAQQADVAFETPAARMERVKLRRSEPIKDEILEWWIHLGFSERGKKKAEAAAVNILLANKAVNIFKRGLFGGKSPASVEPAPEEKTPEKAKKEEVRPAPTPAEKRKMEAEAAGPKRKAGGLAIRDVEKGFVTKVEYIRLCVELWRALSGPDGDGMSEKEVKSAAKKDWKKDSRGMQKMDFPCFFDAIFELADLYTFSISEADYVRFLKATLVRLPKPIADAKPKL